LTVVTADGAMTQSQNVRSLGFCCCWPGYLELTKWWTVQYCAQHWQFQTFAKDAFVFRELIHTMH